MIFADLQPTIPPLAATLLEAVDLDALETAMLAQPQVECAVTHHFGPGIYIREVRIPAGAFIIGHSHTHDNLNVMLTGKLALMIDGHVSIVEAPFMATAKPGRKVAYAIEETVWQNIYATTETDIAKLEATCVEKSAAWCVHQEKMEAIR